MVAASVTQPVASPRTTAPALPPPTAPGSARPVTPARLNPDAVDAAQIAARLEQFEDAVLDEKSCTDGDIRCDSTYAARMHLKLRGSVGRHMQEDRQVHFDAVDLVQLPTVAAPVSFFIQSSPASKDVLHITLEDRLGNRLYTPPPLPAGASTAFGWTRTDDAAGAPLRLRLSARTGSGDHSVDYLVLPVADAQWRAATQTASPRSP